MKIFEDEKFKALFSPNYKYVFNKEDGDFARWGRKKEDDPDYSPFGPEIADIEISTICHGINNVLCSHCYKSNTGNGENMSLDTFKKVFSHLSRTVNQIAFGIGDIYSNKDLFDILKFTRDNGVIPNITINGDNLTCYQIDKLTELCGAIAVSRYSPKDVCYDAVDWLTDKGHSQINIHNVISLETYENCIEVLTDSLTDPRLKKLNAIVFLALKPKGNRNKLTPLKDKDKWQKLIDFALSSNINIGFDSCSAPFAMQCLPNKYHNMIEPCESTLFSIYINVKGEVFPCSFLEDTDHYLGNAVDTDLFKIWNNDKAINFKKELLGCGRKCPKFDIY